MDSRKQSKFLKKGFPTLMSLDRTCLKIYFLRRNEYINNHDEVVNSNRNAMHLQ